MFDHVMFNVSNKKEAMKFYASALESLGANVLYDQNEYAAYGIDSPRFWLREADAESVTRKSHLAFSAGSRKQVDEFYKKALAAGGKSNGEPGLREHGPTYYAAYVFDLEGNNIEAVCTK